MSKAKYQYRWDNGHISLEGGSGFETIHACACMYEQSMNNISLKRPRRYAKSPIVQDAFRPIPVQASEAALWWLGDGDCYFMHRMQSDGWPYSVSRDSLKALSLHAAVFHSKTVRSYRSGWSSRAIACTSYRLISRVCSEIKSDKSSEVLITSTSHGSKS